MSLSPTIESSCLISYASAIAPSSILLTFVRCFGRTASFSEILPSLSTSSLVLFGLWLICSSGFVSSSRPSRKSWQSCSTVFLLLLCGRWRIFDRLCSKTLASENWSPHRSTMMPPMHVSMLLCRTNRIILLLFLVMSMESISHWIRKGLLLAMWLSASLDHQP